MSDVMENSVNDIASPIREVEIPVKVPEAGSPSKVLEVGTPEAILSPNTNSVAVPGTPGANAQQPGSFSLGTDAPVSVNKVTTSRQIALQIRRDKEEQERLARTPPPVPRTAKKETAVKLNPDGTVSASPVPNSSSKKKKSKSTSKAVKSASLMANSVGSKKKRSSSGGVLGSILSSPMSSSKLTKKKTDLNTQMTMYKDKLDALRKEKGRLETKITTDADSIKFPVKDEELLRVIDIKNRGAKKAESKKDGPGSPGGAELKQKNPYPTPLPIPSLVNVLPEGTTLSASAGAAGVDSVSHILHTWSFLTMFHKQLAINRFTLSEYTDLLLYTAKPSVALSEIVSSLLRLILSDAAMSSKLSAHIANINNANSEGTVEGASSVPMSERYGAYSLMPRKLKPDVVTSLTWQVVLRCVLRSVSAVRQAKRSLEEVSSAVGGSASVATEVDGGDATSLPLVTPMLPRSHAVAHLYTVAAAGAVSTPSAAVKDKDALYSISSDVQGFYGDIMRVLQELEGRDFHSFSMDDKLLVLQVLITTCNDTKRILELLANHAEERQEKLLAISKQQQDEKQTLKDARFKLKDYPDADRALAVEHCRIANMEANVAKNAVAAAVSKTSTKTGASAGAGSNKKQKTNSGGSRSGGADVDDTEKKSYKATAASTLGGDSMGRELMADDYVEGVCRLMQTCLIRTKSSKEKGKDKQIHKSTSAASLLSDTSAGTADDITTSEGAASATMGKELRAALKDIRDMHFAPPSQVVQELDDMLMLRKLGIQICITSPATLHYRRKLGIDLNNTRAPPPSPVDGSCGLEKVTSASGTKGSSKGRSNSSQRRSRDAMEAKAEENVQSTDKDGVPLDEYPSDDEELVEAEEMFAFLDRNQKSQMRQKASSMQSERKEKLRRRAELDSTKEQRATANYYLVNAIESRSEKDIKSAIKFAKSWGLQGTIEATGEVYCTKLLKDAYRVRQELEAEAAEEKFKYENDKALDEFFVRVEDVGTDRNNRRYFVFTNDDRLWVEETIDDLRDERERLAAQAAVAVLRAQGPSTPTRAPAAAMEESAAATSSSSSSSNTESSMVTCVTESAVPARAVADSQLIYNMAIDKLKITKPAAQHSRWSVYSSRFAIYKLYDALDTRGEREKKLKSKLKSIFDLNEPPLDFLTTGNELIGRRIRRVYGGKNRKPVFGVITGWLPKEGSDPALWHVIYEDDEEDLEEDEVEEFLVSLEKEATLISPEQISCLEKLLQVQHASQNNDPSAPIVVAPLASVDALTWIGRSANASNSTAGAGEDDEAEFDAPDSAAVVPEIVAGYHNSSRGAAAYKKNSIGLDGLKIDMVYQSNMMADGIKKYYLSNEFSPCTTSSAATAAANLAYSRDDRKQWETGVRNACALHELILLLLDMEKVVHDKVQDCADVVKTEEVLRQKALECQEMVNDGWVFDAATPCLAEKSAAAASTSTSSSSDVSVAASSTVCLDYASLINKRVRRNFRGFGISDGTVTAYLPPSRSEDGAVGFHVVHDDGDEEDLDLRTTQTGVEAFEGRWGVDDERLPAVGEWNEEDGDDASDSSSVAEEEEEEAATGGSYSERHTLWPNTTVRNKWIQNVESAQLVGELALALNIFVEYCRNFGVIGVNPLEDTWGKSTNSIEATSQKHMWCTNHNVLKPPITHAPKKIISRNGSSHGMLSGFATAPSSKRRHSVSKKMAQQQQHNSRAVRSSRSSMSYAGMD